MRTVRAGESGTGSAGSRAAGDDSGCGAGGTGSLCSLRER